MSTGIGETLRAAREEQGRELQDAARILRVRTDYLQALEDERFDAFGGDIYAKGFLRSYAVELGLDPEPLLDIYRREVSEDDLGAGTLVTTAPATRSEPRSTPPAWVAWVTVAVVVLVGLGLLGFLGDQTPETATSPEDPETPPTAADDEDEAEDEGDEDPDPEPNEQETDEPEPPEDEADEEEEIEGVQLLLAFEEDSWVSVIIDGAMVAEETIPSGETRQYEGDEEIEIRFGNPGGVRVEYNGEDLGSPGARGQPRTITFGRDDVVAADGQAV